jgi:hypothetical protein
MEAGKSGVLASGGLGKQTATRRDRRQGIVVVQSRRGERKPRPHRASERQNKDRGRLGSDLARRHTSMPRKTVLVIPSHLTSCLHARLKNGMCSHKKKRSLITIKMIYNNIEVFYRSDQ